MYIMGDWNARVQKAQNKTEKKTNQDQTNAKGNQRNSGDTMACYPLESKCQAPKK